MAPSGTKPPIENTTVLSAEPTPPPRKMLVTNAGIDATADLGRQLVDFALSAHQRALDAGVDQDAGADQRYQRAGAAQERQYEGRGGQRDAEAGDEAAVATVCQPSHHRRNQHTDGAAEQEGGEAERAQ